MLKRINRFLTPNKRKAIYGVVAAAIAALIAFAVALFPYVRSSVASLLA